MLKELGQAICFWPFQFQEREKTNSGFKHRNGFAPAWYIKGAKSRSFRLFCSILLIMNYKRQVGRARFFYFKNHGHITTENDFPAV